VYPGYTPEEALEAPAWVLQNIAILRTAGVING
jgi:hypothetical protein